MKIYMESMREKLIELLDESEDYAVDLCLDIHCEDCPNRKYGSKCRRYIQANRLIANGVTIQRWIPVTERLPTEEDADDDGFVFAYTAEHKKIIARWTDVCRFSDFVTHWMPLPEAPKGE